MPLSTVRGCGTSMREQLTPFGNAPVVIFAGSYTWPPFNSMVNDINRYCICCCRCHYSPLYSLYIDFKGKAGFLTVYITEAHTQDEWPMGDTVLLDKQPTEVYLFILHCFQLTLLHIAEREMPSRMWVHPKHKLHDSHSSRYHGEPFWSRFRCLADSLLHCEKQYSCVQGLLLSLLKKFDRLFLISSTIGPTQSTEYLWPTRNQGLVAIKLRLVKYHANTNKHKELHASRMMNYS